LGNRSAKGEMKNKMKFYCKGISGTFYLCNQALDFGSYKLNRLSHLNLYLRKIIVNGVVI
jgi:hypothetical protein